MFTLNTNRTCRLPVTVTLYDDDGKEQKGQFSATFKVLPTNEVRSMSSDESLLDKVLVAVHDIEVPGKEGDELLAAIKHDPSTATALIGAYTEHVVKKNQVRT